MTKLEAEIHEDVISVLSKIKNITDPEIELIIPHGAVLLENILNLKLIDEIANELEKTVQFSTMDPAGQNLISMLNEEEGVDPFANYAPEEQETAGTGVRDIPKNRSKNAFSKFRMPVIKLNFLNDLPKKAIVAAVAVILVGGLFMFFVSKTPRAEIKIVVNSQPLTKSVQVTVDRTSLSKAETKTLRGIPVTTTIVETLSGDTTGEKVVGKKATGKATIYNRTDEDKEFKKGASLSYDDGDVDYYFTIDETVTVPAAALEDPADPASATVPGNQEVEITAAEVGTSYNLSADETLSVKGYKSSQFSAKMTVKTEGGESSKVKTVTQQDRDKLLTDLTKTITDKANAELEQKVLPGQKFIVGSSKVTETKDSFDKNVNEEASKVTLTKTLTINGLAYATSELDKLLDDLLVEFVPEGFVISDKEKEVSVQVLGNGDNTVLNNDKADLQVTIKTYVVTDIQEDELKNKLKGKNADEAQEILKSIRNVKTYSLEVLTKVPFFKKIPNDVNKIDLTITRE